MIKKISIVIITHNRENLLPFAIESVLKQKFSDFELVIIDDASTDNTEGVVNKYLKDERVKYHKVSKCGSISQVRNKAWSYVNGEYIAVLDSDDIWCDDLKLTKQYEFLENNKDTILVGSGATLIDVQNNKIKNVIKPVFDVDIRKEFLIKNPFFHSSVMFRFDVVKQLGGYDEKIKYGEDLDLWLRMGAIGKLHNLPEVLIKYRIHDDNESSKHFFGAIVGVLKIINKNRKKYGFNPFIFIKKLFNYLKTRV
jgi:glycosyltransferase involved in cell wall biosynthesis